ncbi:MAG TPA: hypothetical protein VGC49_09300 [Solirubrobacterales bacterium]
MIRPKVAVAKGQKSGLETAATAVGLLAGIVAAVYVLGGLVIALRTLFDHFGVNSAVTIIGQLPREIVVTTAMLDVVAPAAVVGLVILTVAGIAQQVGLIRLERSPTASRYAAKPDRGIPRSKATWIVLAALSSVLMAPAIVEVLITVGFPPTFWICALLLFALILTFVAAGLCWDLIQGRRASWSPPVLVLAAAGLMTSVALVPAAMFAAALPFENAQLCLSGSQVAESGLLIGEGGGRVLLEQQSGREASVVSLPVDQVTKSEFGDLISNFACPVPPGTAPVKVAAASLSGHDSVVERKLAMTLRPRLRFDSGERWRPLEVASFVSERFADQGGHGACPTGADPPCPLVGSLRELGRRPDAPAYLDIHGSQSDGADFASPDPACASSPPAVDCNSGPGSVIYYRRSSHEGRWYWDYWWLLRFNDYTGRFNHCLAICGDHEGDWEGITVITTASAQPEILAAIYAAHRDRILIDGATLPLAGGHPVAFVARGTHASYPFDCPRDCRQYASIAGRRLPEDPHDGAVPWGGNRDSECAEVHCVRPLPEIGHPGDAALPLAGAWAGWPGHWGETCHNGCRGIQALHEASPASPGNQIRFQCPWAPTRRAKAAADGSGLTDSEPVGDAERLFALCRAQRGGL